MGESHIGDMPKQIVRVGKGSVTSREGVKQQMGRTTVSAGKYHQGLSSRHTEYQVMRRIGEKEPTKLEMDMLFKDNPREVSTLRAARMNDQEIYNALKER